MTDHGLLGGTLKKWRLSKQLTLQQLADQSGVSRAAISKIERGDSGASSSVVGKLSEALDVSISQLMGGQMRDKVVHIAAEKQPVFTEKRTGFERQSLSPLYLGKGVDFVLNRLPGRAKTGPFPSHRAGVEEHLHVAKGRLKVVLEDKQYIMETGDFLYYRADQTHLFENLGDEVCEYYIVIDSTQLNSL